MLKIKNENMLKLIKDYMKYNFVQLFRFYE